MRKLLRLQKKQMLSLETNISLCISVERLVCAEKAVSLHQFCRDNEIWPSQLEEDLYDDNGDKRGEELEVGDLTTTTI